MKNHRWDSNLGLEQTRNGRCHESSEPWRPPWPSMFFTSKPRSTFERFKCKNYLNKLAFSSGNADMDEGTILKTERE